MDNATMLWNIVAVFFIALGYLAPFVFLAGLVYRLYIYLKTPAPLQIVSTLGSKTG